MTKRVVVRVAARGYVDGRYIGEEKEVIESVDPSGRGKRGRGKSPGKNDNVGNTNDNRGNRGSGRGNKRADGKLNPRGTGNGAGVVKDGGRRRQTTRGTGARDGNALPGAPGAPLSHPRRPPRLPRQPSDRTEHSGRGGKGRNPRAADNFGNQARTGDEASGNVNPRARRGRSGKKTPFRAADTPGFVGKSPVNTQNGQRALISEVAETRRWGDESKSGQFAEALAKEETVKRERLHKVLAQSGHGSRRDMEIMISSGRVMVNGIVATTGTSVSASDSILIDRHLVKLKFDEELPRVLLYHKPDGEIVTTNDPGNRITVFDNLPRVENGKWMSIGRLDINTSGLLIFTTSGELANRLMHPRYEVEREYAVRVLGELTEEQTQRLLDGISIAAESDGEQDDEPVVPDRPAKFDSIDKRGGEGANQWYHVVLREGRNREVRKLFEAVGLTVSRLIRVRFGKIGLPPRLTRGRMVELDQSQVRAVLKWVGMEVEGHVGALPTNNQPNRGQRKNNENQTAGNDEGHAVLQGGNKHQPRERGRRGEHRGGGPRSGDADRQATSADAAIVSGDAAMREFEASHIVGDEGVASVNGDLVQARPVRGAPGNRTSRRGRGRSMRRSRGAGEIDRGERGNGPVSGASNIAAVSDDIGNQFRLDTFSANEDSPDDMIGNRIIAAGEESNPRAQPVPGRTGGVSVGGGRGPDQNYSRGGTRPVGPGNVESGRQHSRGRRKPRKDTDNSGNQ